MEVIKWYCDRCGKEFRVHSRLTPITAIIGQKRTDEFRYEEREFCDKCFPEVKKQILSVLRKETESDAE